ncbi:MAG TPA: ATP-binding protein, partial [Deinococcales bacterium]|nr:ATP-binding protein [Deinococcales bacterium]
RADQYIAFAVDGAQRMQRLIQDLLTFSRVGTRGGDLVPTDPDEVLDEVLRSLRLAVAEANAEIRREPLPAVLADRTQLAQLLQNLLSNAIKFRREGVPPRVQVSARPEGGMVRFSISDNGIGVDSQYFDRIFVIFQRLHGKEEFGGSGIGLAVCKKIVERHGGRIWMDSRPGEGSTFHFTLRAAEAPQGAE